MSHLLRRAWGKRHVPVDCDPSNINLVDTVHQTFKYLSFTCLDSIIEDEVETEIQLDSNSSGKLLTATTQTNERAAATLVEQICESLLRNIKRYLSIQQLVGKYPTIVDDEHL